MSRTLHYDQISGKHQRFHYEEATGTFVIEDVIDVESVLRDNLLIEEQQKPGWAGDMHHVASIDPVTVQGLMKSGVWYDDAALKKWLNDPANRKFRSKKGRL